MMNRDLVSLLAVATLALVSPGGALATAQQRPELPDEVTEWLARDQAQRWARLLEAGEELFEEGVCARCHGQGGAGGRFGPDLTDDDWAHSDGGLRGIRWTILWGVRREDLSDPDRPFMLPKGGMELDADGMAALTAYVWSLSNGTHLSDSR